MMELVAGADHRTRPRTSAARLKVGKGGAADRPDAAVARSDLTAT